MQLLSILEARRIALAAQGFALARPARVDEGDFARVVDHVGLVQLDSVNVVARSHYLPFFARIGAYDRARLDRWVYEGPAMFEQWGHVASLIPIARYGMMRHRMEGWRDGRWARRHPEGFADYLTAVLAEVAERGPMAVAGLEDAGERSGRWWGWGRGKMALEWHFLTGALAAAGRRNFTRLYDVPSRVYPPEVLAQAALTREEAHREMLLIGARCHGVGTLRDLADYYRLKVGEARPRLAELEGAGLLERVTVEGWAEPAYVLPGTVPPPTPVAARALLSPFDSLVWGRARNDRLFGFHYRIEIYTPQAQRRFGYYVMPFLADEQLVARVDLKANRQAATLEVRGAYAEAGARPARVAAALAPELRAMAAWLGLKDVGIGERGDVAAALRRVRSFRPLA